MDPTLTRRRFISGAATLAGGLLYRGDAHTQVPKRRHAFAVIGRGPMGSAAARHLASAGADVVVIGPEEPIDGQPAVVPPASHYDEMRQIELANDSLLLGRLAHASLPGFHELERSTSINFIEDNANLRVGFPTYAARGWEPARAVAKELEVPVEKLGMSELAARFPYLRFPADSRGLLEPGGGIINPRKLVEAQLAAAEKNGATVVTDAAIKLQRKSGEVVIETLSGRRLRADQVLVATGAFTNQTGLLRRDLALTLIGVTIVQAEISPTPLAEMPVVTAVLQGEAGPQILYAMPPREFPDGKTYVKGNSFRWAPSRTAGDGGAEDGPKGSTVVDDPSLMVKMLSEMIPALEVRAERSHFCMTSYTGSGAPYIDRIDDRLGVAVGGNAWGIMTSDEIGRLAAAMMRGEGWSGELGPEIFSARFA
jgi:sarcosine oxidase